MRKISFRAWDFLKKKWVTDGYGLHISLEGNTTIPYNDSEEEIGVGLQQFTGLLDRNGKEIYEGDIVKFYDKVNKKDVLLPIIFDEGQWLMDDGNWKLYLYENREIIEVIGNIYEHPHLLTPTSEVKE